MLALYEFKNSVCCQKVRQVLWEKGLSWESRQVDLFHHQQYNPAYLKLNPKGVVPTLIHDGMPVIESTLICEYLDEIFPEPRLMPAQPQDRAHMRLWSKMVDEGLHEGVSEISFSAMFRERLRNSSESERQTRFNNIGDPRRRDRFASTYEHGVESPFVLWAIAAFERAFEKMNKDLQGGNEWLLGSMYSLADINMAPYVARLEYLTLLDVWIADRPLVRAWWERLKSRSAFQAAIADPMLPQELEDMRAFGGKIRHRVAELRVGLPAVVALAA